MTKLQEFLQLESLQSHQLISAGIALVLVELFLKLGSFTLECVCFLALWFLMDRMYLWHKKAS